MIILAESTFKIGDEVIRKSDNTDRIGIVLKVKGDYVTVGFSPTDKLPGRKDVYYSSELQKVTYRG